MRSSTNPTPQSPDPQKSGTLQAWLLAARPKTLFAALTPVIVGSAVAYQEKVFQPGPALAALFGAIWLQVGANLANDVFDFHRGADTAERLGPLRVTQAGLLSPSQVKRGMAISFGLAALAGVHLIWAAGWPVVILGVSSIAAAILYTAGPFPLGYLGLGDLFVFVFFGLAAVGGTYYVQARSLSPAALWAAFPIGFLATAILVVNNLRDIATDRASGKRTLAVRLGERGAIFEYTLLLVLAYLTPLLEWSTRGVSPWVLLSWASLPLAFSLIRAIRKARGRALNPLLAKTSLLELIFGLLYAFGSLLALS